MPDGLRRNPGQLFWRAAVADPCVVESCLPMLTSPNIDPVAVHIGPIAVHWYGIAYIVGIVLGWWLLQLRAGRGQFDWSRDDVADVVFFAALGAVLGGRIGYILFYNFADYLSEPLSIFAVWRGGMSFHGGVLGFMVALAWFARRRQRAFLAVTDFVVPVVPVGLLFGRVANFVNQELWGAPTSMPWGVVFTNPAAGGIARHPTQLYEAGLEGVVLFLILWTLSRVPRARGLVSGVFLAGYGVFRCSIEFVREPDQHIGYLAGGWLTMGHVLSVPMIVGGLGLVTWALSRNDHAPRT